MNSYNKFVTSLIAVFLLFPLFTLTGCAASSVNMHFHAARVLNPDVDRHSLPVLVRVYALNSDRRFNDATFHQLWQEDRHVLGHTMDHRQESMVNPNSHTSVTLSCDKTTKYIAVTAIFRHPRDGHWRLIEPLPNKVSLMLGGIKVKLIGNAIKFN